MNLEKYKAQNELSTNDIVDMLKPEFPRFDKRQVSMVTKGTYGVVLAPKAVRILTKCESESRTMQDVAEMAIYTYLKPEALRIESQELNLKPDKELLMKVYNLKNELCLKCGNYQLAHHGACDNCRWKQ